MRYVWKSSALEQAVACINHRDVATIVLRLLHLSFRLARTKRSLTLPPAASARHAASIATLLHCCERTRIPKIYGPVSAARFASFALQIELLFRSKYFNKAARKNGPMRPVDKLPVRQIYSMKYETDNQALHAKAMSSLLEKPNSCHVQVRLRVRVRLSKGEVRLLPGSARSHVRRSILCPMPKATRPRTPLSALAQCQKQHPWF